MKQPKAAPRHRGAAFLHGKTAQHTHGRGEDSKAPAGRVLPFSRQTAPPSQEAARESCGSGRENTVPVIGRIETPEAQGFQMRMRPVRNRTRPCKKVQRVRTKTHIEKEDGLLSSGRRQSGNVAANLLHFPAHNIKLSQLFVLPPCPCGLFPAQDKGFLQPAHGERQPIFINKQQDFCLSATVGMTACQQ